MSKHRPFCRLITPAILDRAVELRLEGMPLYRVAESCGVGIKSISRALEGHEALDGTRFAIGANFPQDRMVAKCELTQDEIARRNEKANAKHLADLKAAGHPRGCSELDIPADGHIRQPAPRMAIPEEFGNYAPPKIPKYMPVSRNVATVEVMNRTGLNGTQSIMNHVRVSLPRISILEKDFFLEAAE